MEITLNKNIAVITTGGTIGSVLKTESISVDLSEKKITQEIRHAQERLGYSTSVFSALNKHSEDFIPSDWGIILDKIKQVHERSPAGIVITHGTDTMAFSVAAVLCFANIWKKKICFTGSYYSPDQPKSDTSINLLAALQFVAADHPSHGVYVAFRSNRSNSEARIIHGIDLKPMTFDEFWFEPAYGQRVAVFSPNSGIAKNVSLSTVDMPTLGSKDIPTQNEIEKASSQVAMLSIYPGIDSSLIKAASRGRKFLILQMYHSGTGPSNPQSSDFLKVIKEISSDTQILMGTFPSQHIEFPYESTNKIKNTGAIVYSDLQTHFLYAFSLLGVSLGMGNKEITDKLDNWTI